MGSGEHVLVMQRDLSHYASIENGADTSSMYSDDFQIFLGSKCPYLQSVQELINRRNNSVRRSGGWPGHKGRYLCGYRKGRGGGTQG